MAADAGGSRCAERTAAGRRRRARAAAGRDGALASQSRLARTGADGIWSAAPTLLVNGRCVRRDAAGRRDLVAPAVVTRRCARRIARASRAASCDRAGRSGQRHDVRRRRRACACSSSAAWSGGASGACAAASPRHGDRRASRRTCACRRRRYRVRATTAADRTNAAGALTHDRRARPRRSTLIDSPSSGCHATDLRVRRPTTIG